MIDDRFHLSVEGYSGELRVVRFTGHEGVSELFRFEVVFLAKEPIAAADFVRKKVTLTFGAPEEAVPRAVHGIVGRFREGELGRAYTRYHLTIVPEVQVMLHRQTSRIFQEKTAKDIINAVLDGASQEAVHLEPGAFSAREYCVQYRETDWNFISRLLEEEGCFYYFDHSSAPATLTIADEPSAISPIAGTSSIAFRTEFGAHVGEAVKRFDTATEFSAGKAVLRDWDFKKPSYLLEQKADGTSDTDLEIYDYPGPFVADADGEQFVKRRLQERDARRKRMAGESNVERFVPGASFTLTDHPNEACNAEYFILRVEHEGFDPGAEGGGNAGEVERYQNRFECLPKSVPYHPALVTRKPVVMGIQTAFVTGPSGEEIYVDRYGRIKVQFHWDRLGKKDDHSSCWIRVGQIMAGEAFGAMFIPRIGHEVIVNFLEGDPDRPLVVGSVYNGTNVPPYALPDNKTVSTIKTNSSKGGGGSNELRFEDKKNNEEVYLHAQKDLTILVENDKNQTVKHDETLAVNHDRTLTIDHDQSEKIGNNEVFEVGNDRAKKVGRDETEDIGNNRTISVGADHTESIGGAMALSVTKAHSADFGDASTVSVAKNSSLSVGGDSSIDITGGLSTKVGADETLDVKLEQKITVGEKITITCGDAKVTIAKNGDITVDGKNLSIKASGDVKVEAQGKAELKITGDVKLESQGKVEVKAAATVDVSASGALKLKGASVGIN
jgi:type VI secretion system secreted protein VgrG